MLLEAFYICCWTIAIFCAVVIAGAMIKELIRQAVHYFFK